MRTIAIRFAVLAAAAVPVAASAQEMSPAQPPQVEEQRALNTITVNPLALLFGTINFEYERATSPHLSVFVGPSYSSLSDGAQTVTGVGGSAGLRLFPGGLAPEGFFVGPTFQMAYAGSDVPGSPSALVWGAGGILGYTWLIGGFFDVSIGAGAQYMSFEVDSVYGGTVGFTGILPAIRLALGGGF